MGKRNGFIPNEKPEPVNNKFPETKPPKRCINPKCRRYWDHHATICEACGTPLPNYIVR